VEKGWKRVGKGGEKGVKRVGKIQRSFFVWISPRFLLYVLKLIDLQNVSGPSSTCFFLERKGGRDGYDARN
jgi:hypothetical protein